MIAVAVPVKDLTAAKQRLADIIDARARAALARAMLRDVLRAVSDAPVDRVWVVTRDPEVVATARVFGAEILLEDANRGHTAAVARAQRRASGEAARLFATIPGDVPCVTAEEIRVLLTAADAPCTAAFTPSRSGLGTNGAALAPADVIPLTFGEPSFENHLATARARGVTTRVVMLAGLGLDIDTPDDLAALLEQGPATESGRLVAGWRALHRARDAAVAKRSTRR